MFWRISISHNLVLIIYIISTKQVFTSPPPPSGVCELGGGGVSYVFSMEAKYYQ
jgi:hypothetical protein